MKITYFTDTFLPKIDGVANSVITIATALTEKGYQIQIFAPRPKNMREINWTAKNIALVMLRSIPSFLYPEFRAATPISPKLVMHLRNFKPDVIHFQTTFLIGAGGILLGKIIRKPIIGTFHTNFMHEEYLRIMKLNYQPEVLSSILWKYALLFFNQCNSIHVPSQETARSLKAKGVKRPIYVIPNSIDESKITLCTDQEIEALKQKLNLKKKVFLYVGRISSEKSIDELVKSFAILEKAMKDVSLLVIGYGPKLKDMQKLVKELSLTDKVVFTGKIIQEHLLSQGYFQLADAFVTPSSSEVQPISIIEAMYFGLPLVGVSKRGVGEMLRGVGLLSTPHDAGKLAANMRKVLSNEALRRKLSRSSKAVYANKYKLEKNIILYEKLYQNTVLDYKRRKDEKSVNLSSIFLDE